MTAPTSAAYKGYEPQISAWVSASAGCGKTWLLTRRVLRLLLEPDAKGNPPRILCLTFTNAAAAEMQERVHKELSHWAVCTDDVLRATLLKELGISASEKQLRQAQRLFARVLDNPDCLRILTVHGFCQHVLHRFPLEAGLSPHFNVLEGLALKEFNDRVIDAFIEKASARADLRAAMHEAAALKGSEGLKAIFQNIIQDYTKWRAFLETTTADIFNKKLLKTHTLEAFGTVRSVLQKFVEQTNEKKLRQSITALLGGSKTTAQIAQKMASWLEKGDEKIYACDDYFSCFLTQDHTISKKFPNPEFIKTNPDIAQFLAQEAARVLAAFRTAKTHEYIGFQRALYALAAALVAFAEELRREEAVLTFDDLITRTAALFSQSSMADWILYKLDYDIDHLLIDEAQDTSPTQWDVVLSLLREFQAGLGARSHARRTLFVVGDEKQSIFSFQGANRNYYLQVRAQVIAALTQAEKNYAAIELTTSYRSAPGVLAFADHVFAPEDARKGVSEKPLRHHVNRLNANGYVELWPIIKEQKKSAATPWQLPIRQDMTEPVEVQIAQRIAKKIRYWLDHGYRLVSSEEVTEGSRPVGPGDIMILLERRSRMMPAIVRALKDYHVPVAGVDRLEIKEHPAVQDIIALCRFLLLPQDDLALAEVLRGPFIRMGDDDLFKLAHARMGSLWQSVQQADAFALVRDYLAQWLSKLDFIEPFALITQILTQPCPADNQSGLHALTLRLGQDAIDPVEELLTFILQQSGTDASTLQGFMRIFSRYEEETKRDLMKAEGSVRVLSVHGSKGLEAPIVFMPDTMRNFNRKATHPLFYWNTDNVPLPAFEKNCVEALENAKALSKQASEEEHQRLLYVALTRARDVLIVGGVEGQKANKSANWYGYCRAAMETLAISQMQDENGDPVWRYGQSGALFTASVNKKMSSDTVSLPEWIRKSLPQEVAPDNINPSRLGSENEKIMASANSNEMRFSRGLYLHRLLQMLPALPVQTQEDYARRYLQKQNIQPDALENDVQEIMRVLRDPVFGDVFSCNSQAEVPLVGRVNGRMISGQIDRLVIKPDEVLVVDFKTNRPPPRHCDAVSAAYCAQMASYHQLLSQIYSSKTIRLALLWTNVPSLMELDEAALDRGLAILEKAA